MKTSKISIVIIEDNKKTSSNLMNWLFCKTDLINLAESVELAGSMVASLKPNLIFLNTQMSKLGVDSILIYKELSPNSKIIVISDESNLDEIATCVQHKADYFINKNKLNKEMAFSVLEAYIKTQKSNDSIWNFFKLFNLEKEKECKTISIIEDDDLFSFHLTWKLGQTIKNNIINSYTNADSFISYSTELKSEIVFLDYYLPDSTGAKLVDYISSNSPSTKIIIISAQDDPKIATDLIQKGIYGYIIKNKNWENKLNEYMYELNI